MSLDQLRDLVGGPQSDPDDTLQYVRDDALVFETASHVDVVAEVGTDHFGESRLFQTLKSPIFVGDETAYLVGVSRLHDDPEPRQVTNHMEGKALTKPLRLLSTVFPLALLVVDLHGYVVAASPSWSETFGSHSTGLQALFSETYTQLGEVGAIVDEPGTVVEAQVVRMHVAVGDGAERDYEFRISPWGYDDDAPGGLLVLALDVTADQTQKMQLEEANERYDLVLASTSVGIWDWSDIRSDQQYWSRRFYELIGYEEGEIEASHSTFCSLLHPNDQEHTLDGVDRRLVSSDALSVDYRLKTKSGTYRWFRGRAIARHSGTGQPTRMVGSIQDIDEQVRFEQRLERVNEDLEHFAHVAAHDLREPARRQRMLINFVLEDHSETLSPEVRQDLESAREQCDVMLGMITGFRSLTGLGGMLDIEQLDVADLVTRIASEVIADAKVDVELSIDLPNSIGAYPALLETLFRNLTENALRHGGQPMWLSYSQDHHEDKTWFSVSNSWEGDPSTVTQKIFRPFVSHSGTSTGLGLSICKRVVDRHRGEIEVQATADSFTVRFNLGEQ